MVRIPSPTADRLETKLTRLYEKRQVLDLLIETLERYATYDNGACSELHEPEFSMFTVAGLS